MSTKKAEVSKREELIMYVPYSFSIDYNSIKDDGTIKNEFLNFIIKSKLNDGCVFWVKFYESSSFDPTKETWTLKITLDYTFKLTFTQGTKSSTIKKQSYFIVDGKPLHTQSKHLICLYWLLMNYQNLANTNSAFSKYVHLEDGFKLLPMLMPLVDTYLSYSECIYTLDQKEVISVIGSAPIPNNCSKMLELTLKAFKKKLEIDLAKQQ